MTINITSLNLASPANRVFQAITEKNQSFSGGKKTEDKGDVLNLNENIKNTSKSYEALNESLDDKIEANIQKALEAAYGKEFTQKSLHKTSEDEIHNIIQEKLYPNQRLRDMDKVYDSENYKEISNKILEALGMAGENGEFEQAKEALNNPPKRKFKLAPCSPFSPEYEERKIEDRKFNLLSDLRRTHSYQYKGELSLQDYLRIVLNHKIWTDLYYGDKIQKDAMSGKVNLEKAIEGEKKALRAAYLLNAILPDPVDARYYIKYDSIFRIMKDSWEKLGEANQKTPDPKTQQTLDEMKELLGNNNFQV